MIASQQSSSAILDHTSSPWLGLHEPHAVVEPRLAASLQQHVKDHHITWLHLSLDDQFESYIDSWCIYVIAFRFGTPRCLPLFRYRSIYSLTPTLALGPITSDGYINCFVPHNHASFITLLIPEWLWYLCWQSEQFCSSWRSRNCSSPFTHKG